MDVVKSRPFYVPTWTPVPEVVLLFFRNFPDLFVWNTGMTLSLCSINGNKIGGGCKLNTISWKEQTNINESSCEKNYMQMDICMVTESAFGLMFFHYATTFQISIKGQTG
jgi:hypothetical protein